MCFNNLVESGERTCSSAGEDEQNGVPCWIVSFHVVLVCLLISTIYIVIPEIDNGQFQTQRRAIPLHKFSIEWVRQVHGYIFSRHVVRIIDFCQEFSKIQ